MDGYVRCTETVCVHYQIHIVILRLVEQLCIISQIILVLIYLIRGLDQSLSLFIFSPLSLSQLSSDWVPLKNRRFKQQMYCCVPYDHIRNIHSH